MDETLTVKEISFFFWADPEEEENPANRGRWPDFADDDAQAVALDVEAIAGEHLHQDVKWKNIGSSGGAGTDWVMIIGLASGLATLLEFVMSRGGKALALWRAISPLWLKLQQTTRGHWNASCETAILLCLAKLQEENADAYTDPDLVRVIEDGAQQAMWGGARVGMHIVMIPELSRRQTHVFVVTDKLEILSQTLVDRLPEDANSLGYGEKGNADVD
jgi:hypothetical protein